MSWHRPRLTSPRVLAIGGALSAVLTLGHPAGGHAASAVNAAAPALRGHVMATLPASGAAGLGLAGSRETTGDCVLPLIIAVECAGAGTPMTSGGGAIQTAPAVYIVLWGWHNVDPSGQSAYQQAFFNGIGGSPWNSTQTQYCTGTSDALGLTCPSTASFVGNPGGLLKGVWPDETNAVPANPTDADISAEAVRAAANFHNITATSNGSTQYIIDTPHGNSTAGFGTQWCAYHSSVSSGYGTLSYTDFPYITDAGGSCGQNFVNSGAAGLLDGVSIVGGHEFAESETDPVPATGWTDTIGAETGDKCAWISLGPGASTDITLPTGTFAVQSLWSNLANSGAGGCATS